MRSRAGGLFHFCFYRAIEQKHWRRRKFRRRLCFQLQVRLHVFRHFNGSQTKPAKAPSRNSLILAVPPVPAGRPLTVLQGARLKSGNFGAALQWLCSGSIEAAKNMKSNLKLKAQAPSELPTAPVLLLNSSIEGISNSSIESISNGSYAFASMALRR